MEEGVKEDNHKEDEDDEGNKAEDFALLLVSRGDGIQQ